MITPPFLFLLNINANERHKMEISSVHLYIICTYNGEKARKIATCSFG